MMSVATMASWSLRDRARARSALRATSSRVAMTELEFKLLLVLNVVLDAFSELGGDAAESSRVLCDRSQREDHLGVFGFKDGFWLWLYDLKYILHDGKF